MDLSKKSPANVMYIIEAIKGKLRMVNIDAMRAKNFRTSKYDDLPLMYNMVRKR